MNTEVEKLFEELKNFHMDQYELNFWKEVFPGLPEEEKQTLFENLSKQAELLKKINTPLKKEIEKQEEGEEQN